MPQKELEEVPRCQTGDPIYEGVVRGLSEVEQPSVPIVGLVDACLEIASRSTDVLQVIINSVLHL